jgi:hypothetical protein
MSFCHKCRCDKPTVDVLMNFDGTEHVIDMKDRYDGSPDVVEERATYTVPLCSVCRRPNWEAMAFEHRCCTPNKERDNCPDWGARDYKACLKAIATKSDGIISEVYMPASMDEIQRVHGSDQKALAKAVKMRAGLLDAIAQNPFAKIGEQEPKVEEKPKMEKPQKYTLIHCNAGAMTSRHNITGVITGDNVEFKIEGKRKVLVHQMKDSTILLPGWDTLFADSDGGGTVHGNACLNISARTGMAMQPAFGLGKKEPILHSPEAVKLILERNLNPKLDKALILYWTPDGQDKDEPIALYPELAAERHHAVLDEYLERKDDACDTPPTSSKSPENVTPPTPPAPPVDVSGTIKEEPVKAAATSSTGCSQGLAHIEAHTHLKKGFQYYIVVPHERVSREEWVSITGKARAVGGWYGNKYKDVPGGYCFKDKLVAEKFMADHFGGVTSMVPITEDVKQIIKISKEIKAMKMGPLATCHISNKPNVMHLKSGAELYGPGVIESDDHGERVIVRLMASGIDWNLPLEKLQENPAIESIVTEALSEKQHTFSDNTEPDVAPEPEPAAKVTPESNVVKVDFSTPDVDLELQQAMALADSL